MNPTYRPYTCLETCGQEKHCGNTHCSAHPRYVPPKPKEKTASRRKTETHFYGYRNP